MKVLREDEATRILDKYGLNYPIGVLIEQTGDMPMVTEKLEFPVAVKISSPDILHKTDVGGVKVGVGREQLSDTVRNMWEAVTKKCPDASIIGCYIQQIIPGGVEMVIGIKKDPVFGPVITLGLGGIMVELLHDITFRLCPVSYEDVLEMLKEIRGKRILFGYRAYPVCDVKALCDSVVKISRFAYEQEWLVEADFNPVVVLEEGKGVQILDFKFFYQDEDELEVKKYE